MASTSLPELALLEDLVAIPSVSGTEETLGRWIEERVRGWGLDVRRDDASVTVSITGAQPGPALALVSHLDTVPPVMDGPEPFIPTIEGDLLYGRGSGDAKASVAAMLSAARDLAAEGGPERSPPGHTRLRRGTRHTTMPVAVERAGPSMPPWWASRPISTLLSRNAAS